MSENIVICKSSHLNGDCNGCYHSIPHEHKEICDENECFSFNGDTTCKIASIEERLCREEQK